MLRLDKDRKNINVISGSSFIRQNNMTKVQKNRKVTGKSAF